MMKTVAASILALTALTGCHRSATLCPEPIPLSPAPTSVASSPAPSAETARVIREPVIRLTEGSGWGPLQNTEIPEFTLYEDGLALFVRGEGEDAVAMQAQLSREETYALLDRVHAALGSLPERLGRVNGRDIPHSTIAVSSERIYSVRMSWPDDPASASGTFKQMRDLLQSWDHPDAAPWTPDELEIVLVRRDNLEGIVQAWPSALPRPPAAAREPRPQKLGGKSETLIQQPIRYRVPGDLEAALASTLPDPKGQDGVAWNSSTWLVRYERVVPARTWLW